MNMYTLRPHDKTLPQIALFVIAVHAILILWIIFVTPIAFKPHKQAERLLVKTVQLNPRPAQTIAPTQFIETPPLPAPLMDEPKPILETIPEPAEMREVLPLPVIEQTVPLETVKYPEKSIKKTEPEKESAPPVKKAETPKPPQIKKITPKKLANPVEKKPIKNTEPVKKTITKQNSSKKPAVKAPAKPNPEKPKIDPKVEAAKSKAQQETQNRQKKLIAAAQESIAKIDQGLVKINAAKSSLNTISTVPAALASLQIDALPATHAEAPTPGEKSYRDELASRLKLMLKLPEHGDVQLKLTLDRLGKAVKVSIIKSASSANRSYVEKTLLNLKFPPLGNHFENMSEYTFIIHLSNEI